MKDDDGMTPFQRETLRLQQAAIDAQNANTAALLALKATEMTPDERSAKELAIMRRGGPPIAQADYEGVASVVGKCGEPSPPVQVRGRFNASGARAGIAIEVCPDDAGRELVMAWCAERFDRENPQLVKEATGDGERHAHYLKTRDRKVGQDYYFSFVLPLIRAVVGKTRAQSAHAVKWAEAPVWTSGPTAETTAAAPAPETEPGRPAPPVLDAVEKRAGVLRDPPKGSTPYPGMT